MNICGAVEMCSMTLQWLILKVLIPAGAGSFIMYMNHFLSNNDNLYGVFESSN